MHATTRTSFQPGGLFGGAFTTAFASCAGVVSSRSFDVIITDEIEMGDAAVPGSEKNGGLAAPGW